MDTPTLIVDVVIILAFLGGFTLFRSPRTARLGNGVATAAFAAAIASVLLGHGVSWWGVVAVALGVGGAVGLYVALKVTMLQIPAMVAFQHGAGAVAAFMVSIVELNRAPVDGVSVEKWSGLLGLVLGAATFTASMVASGKLAGRLKQTPVVFRGHSRWIGGIALVTAAVALLVGFGSGAWLMPGTLLLLATSMTLGCVVAVRVGGADMPVLISFLNAAAGLAAAFCGVIIGNRLLIACGATVAASGTILTHVMCRAMNRDFAAILMGAGGSRPGGGVVREAAAMAVPESVPDRCVPAAPTSRLASPTSSSGSPSGAELLPGAGASIPSAAPEPAVEPMQRAVEATRSARRVLVVPGYGMALAQAQFKLVELANLMEARGAVVEYAIHPVAGRMPGHMNVLLAEADVSYDKLLEMDQANPLFAQCDLAMVVGACDVVNPAAMEREGTPISGMPVFPVARAKQVIVCNLDSRPGYSGVPNTLYEAPNAILLFGNARESLEKIVEAVKA